jgi:hypothetical protein
MKRMKADVEIITVGALNAYDVDETQLQQAFCNAAQRRVPLVVRNLASTWPCCNWTPNVVSQRAGGFIGNICFFDSSCKLLAL